eukprot:scaffold2825_cov111-Isochrysis_galbana.AAC.5
MGLSSADADRVEQGRCGLARAKLFVSPRAAPVSSRCLRPGPPAGGRGAGDLRPQASGLACALGRRAGRPRQRGCAPPQPKQASGRAELGAACRAGCVCSHGEAPTTEPAFAWPIGYYGGEAGAARGDEGGG